MSGLQVQVRRLEAFCLWELILHKFIYIVHLCLDVVHAFLTSSIAGVPEFTLAKTSFRTVFVFIVLLENVNWLQIVESFVLGASFLDSFIPMVVSLSVLVGPLSNCLGLMAIALKVLNLISLLI